MAGDSKTEKATHKKRQDERKKGNVFVSRDVVILISLIVMFFCLKLMMPKIYVTMRQYLMSYIGMMPEVTEISTPFTLQLMQDGIKTFFQMCALLLFVSIMISVVVTMFQTKMLFATENLKPKFNRLNPLEGIKRLFSLRSVVELIKGLIKLAILIVIIYQYIQKHILKLPDLISMDLLQSSSEILDMIFGLVINVSIAFTAISALDYFYQWWEYERQIKMSKQEVKEEYKQLEGDPQIKGKIKEMQRKMAMSRMMQAVPSADVVIKNPTHFAVALKYDSEKNGAPVVVAKGQDELALRIIRVAEENHVFVIENRPLARGIFAAAEVNQEIPADYYGAIAEILVYVYKSKKK